MVQGINRLAGPGVEMMLLGSEFHNHSELIPSEIGVKSGTLVPSVEIGLIF